MRLYVNVANAEWQPGCDDTDDHDHPAEFDAVVCINGFDWMSPAARLDAIHQALIDQCECCIIDGDFEVIEPKTSTSS